VFSIYFVTLGVFPGLTKESESLVLGDWYTVLRVTVFNICDTLGRIASAQHRLASYEKGSRKFAVVAVVTTLRFLIIPIIAFSVANRASSWIQSEILVFILTIFLGLTNG